MFIIYVLKNTGNYFTDMFLSLYSILLYNIIKKPMLAKLIDGWEIKLDYTIKNTLDKFL